MAHQVMLDPYGRSQEERKALRDKMEQIDKIAQDNWDNPQWRREMAQEVTETVYMGFEHENLLSLIANVENAPFDGRVFVKEVRGLRAFWVARGGYIEASTIRSEVMEIPRDTIGFHVFENEDKIMTNFSETQSNLVSLGVQRLDAEVNLRVLGAFQAAVPDSSSDYYIDGAGVSLAAINTALTAVRDESRDYNVAIIGRATMIDQIYDELLGSSGIGGGFLPETNEALIQKGIVGTYRGAKLITLTNWKDDTEAAFWPANEAWVVARDASKFAFFGGLMSKEFTEQDNWYWHYLARRDFGGVVHRPERLRRIIDTSLAP